MDSLARPAPGVALPSADALPAVLLQLAVPREDMDAPRGAAAAGARQSPAVWWLLERCVQLRHGRRAGGGRGARRRGRAETPRSRRPSAGSPATLRLLVR